MRNISIAEKLIFYFVLIGIVSIISVGSTSYYFAKKAILDRTFDQLISLRLEKKNRIEQFFVDRFRDISLVSNSDEIAKTLQKIQPQQTNNELSKTTRYSYFDQFVIPYGYFQHLYAVNLKEEIVEISNDDSSTLEENSKIPVESIKSVCRKIKEHGIPVIRDVTKTDRFLYFGNPIINDNKVTIGYVVMSIPIAAINKIMFEHTENNGLGNTGETYLVSDDTLMRSNSRFEVNAVMNIKVASSSVKNALNDKVGVDIVRDYRNISCLSSYSKVKINGLNWSIIAEIDEKEAMTPIYAIRNSILLISIIIAGGIFILAFFISMRISLPLKRLRTASEQIGAGKYDVNLKVSSHDEIGALTETFNEMTIRLKTQAEEIEIEKNKRISSLFDGQEMERQRLARDLHDGLGQSILTANMKLEQTKSAEVEKRQVMISETQVLLKEIIQEIRNISNNLMPPILANFGLKKGLKNLIEETAKGTGLKIVYQCDPLPEQMPSHYQIYIFRIIQEALNNIIKHSSAEQVKICLSFVASYIHLEISDNGNGFDVVASSTRGNGIPNIKERVKSLKGECRFYSSEDTGTQITIKIPFTSL